MYKLITESNEIPSKFTGIAEHPDGSKYWFKEGKLHRLDGPAIEWADGSKEWYKEGKRHRLDGPAIEWADGSKHWWKEGKFLTEDEFNQKDCSGKVVEIDGKKDEYEVIVDEKSTKTLNVIFKNSGKSVRVILTDGANKADVTGLPKDCPSVRVDSKDQCIYLITPNMDDFL